MANLFANAAKPSNTSYQPNTTNLGFQMPGGQGPWDSSPQNSDPKFNFGGGANALGGNAPGGGYTPNPLIKNYMTQQTAENQRSRAANVGRWNDASSFLKNYTTPYDPATIAKMKASNAMTAQGGQNNMFREQQGIMDASGQGDASSLAAASAEAGRNALGARVGADNALDMKTHEANNTAGMQVGSTILSNLPQDRPDQFGQFAALGLADQNNQFNQGMMGNAMTRPIAPGMTNSRPFLGGGGGVNPESVSYNPAGQYSALNSAGGNGQPNGNALTAQYGAPSGSPFAGNYQAPGDPSWWNKPGGAGGAQYNFTNGVGR